MSINKTNNYFSSKALNRGNLILLTFVSFLLIGILCFVFIGANKSKVNALDILPPAGGSCTGTYPTNGYGFFDCADTFQTQTTNGDSTDPDAVLDASSAAPASCPKNGPGGDLNTTICSSSSTSYVSDAADFTKQLITDATSFCNTHPGNGTAQQQNGVGALFIIYTMTGTTEGTGDTQFSSSTYCPNSSNGLSIIEGQWQTMIESNFADGTTTGSINWDYCPGANPSTSSPSGTKTTCPGYSYTENTRSAPGNDSAGSGYDDIFAYGGKDSGSANVPAIAFWYKSSTETGSPSYIIKYYCGNPVGTMAPAPTNTVYGYVYYLNKGVKTDLPTPTNLYIDETDCDGSDIKNIDLNNIDATHGGLKTDYSYEANVGSEFCLTPKSTSYEPPGGTELFKDPVITPEGKDLGALGNPSGTCGSDPTDEYINQFIGTTVSDSSSGACNYHMTDNYGYDFEYSIYDHLSPTGTCSANNLPEISNTVNTTTNATSLTITWGSNSVSVPIVNGTFDWTNPTNPSSTTTYTVKGTFSDGSTLSPTVSIFCQSALRTPFLNVQGGDVEAGVSYGNGCTPDSVATIMAETVKNGSQYLGAGGQLAAIAPAIISGFTTAQNPDYSAGDPSIALPTGLTLGNLDSNGVYPECVPSYYSQAISNTTVNLTSSNIWTRSTEPMSILTFGETNLVTSSPGTFSGGIDNTPGLTTLVFTGGSIYISGNITYGSYGSISSMPRFELIDSGGDIYISPQVNNLAGIYVAQPNSSGSGGDIYTCASSTPADDPVASDCNTTLVVNGALSATRIYFHRTSGSVTTTTSANPDPAETIIYSPEVWLPQTSAPPTIPTYDSIESLPPVL